jgi:NAD-dependent SIR2 family protein deacetylase
MTNHADLRRAAEAVREADALLITAGAGMGVDSGLPDFRGMDGFWKAYPPIAALGLRFEEIANPDWFERDPTLAWGFYGHRALLYRSTPPHAGFAIVNRWAESKPAGWFVFTSNVDGQFQKAGFDPDRIVECHGSLEFLQCREPCGPSIWSVDGALLDVDVPTMRAKEPLPSCVHCGTTARPNVLMFGDSLWCGSRTESQYERMRDWLATLRNRRLVILEFGAGSAVPTVRRTSEHLARLPGATLIRINPREPETPAGHIGLAMGALEAVERLQGFE